jgi:hypothetical protein
MTRYCTKDTSVLDLGAPFSIAELHPLLWCLTKWKWDDPAPSPASREEKAPHPTLRALCAVDEQQPVTGCQRVWTPGDKESVSAGPAPELSTYLRLDTYASGSSTARGYLCDSSPLHDRAAVIARSSTDAGEETGPCSSLNSRTKGAIDR